MRRAQTVGAVAARGLQLELRCFAVEMGDEPAPDPVEASRQQQPAPKLDDCQAVGESALPGGAEGAGADGTGGAGCSLAGAGKRWPKQAYKFGDGVDKLKPC